MKTVTRKILAKSLRESYPHLHGKESEHLIKEIFNEMAAAILKDDYVKIVNFGSFHIKEKRERIARNPKTGESAIVSKRKIVTFKPSDHLRYKISKK